MDQLEFKATFTAGDAGQIAGYASLFGRPADAVHDLVAHGAFKASLMLRTPEMKSEHGGPVIGVWDEVVDASGARVLQQIELHEISVVRNPASSRSRILSVKSKEGTMPENDKGAAPDTAALEGKIADLDKQVKSIPAVDIKPLADRLDKLEAKASLPATAVDPKDTEKLEFKALSDFLRTGNIEVLSATGASFETKSASSDNNPGGGYFVLPTVDLSIRNLMTDLSPMRGLAEIVTISTDSYVRFYGFGKRGAEWVSEREDRPQDTARPDAKKLTVGVAELYAAPVTTRHLLEDAAVDIASWLINNAIHDFSETEDAAWLRGDGIDGRPTGLLTYGTTSEKDFTRAWGKHQYIPAGHASAPTDANLVKACITLVASLRKPYKANAAWYMNSATATRLQTITDDNGRRLWAPTGNLIEGVEHPLLGYRVEIDEGMDDIGANTHPIAFGDFRQGYVIVDRQGIRTNIDEVTRKGFVVLDTYKRVGGAAGDFNAIKFLKIAAN
jgi:HK97 family phage major capsid protein